MKIVGAFIIVIFHNKSAGKIQNKADNSDLTKYLVDKAANEFARRLKGALELKNKR